MNGRTADHSSGKARPSMRPNNHEGAESLSLSAAKRIDEVCTRFEAAWQAGQAPRIQDFLGDTQGAEQETLRWELLRIEIDYRLRQGRVPTAEEYRSRFPGREAALGKEIEACVARAAGRPRPDDTLKTRAESDGTGVRTVPHLN